MNTFGLMELIVLSIGYVLDVPFPKVSTIQYLRWKQELATVNHVPERM